MDFLFQSVCCFSYFSSGGRWHGTRTKSSSACSFTFQSTILLNFLVFILFFFRTFFLCLVVDEPDCFFGENPYMIKFIRSILHVLPGKKISSPSHRQRPRENETKTCTRFDTIYYSHSRLIGLYLPAMGMDGFFFHFSFSE